MLHFLSTAFKTKHFKTLLSNIVYFLVCLLWREMWISESCLAATCRLNCSPKASQGTLTPIGTRKQFPNKNQSQGFPFTGNIENVHWMILEWDKRLTYNGKFWKKKEKRQENNIILFCSKLSPMPNKDFKKFLKHFNSIMIMLQVDI